MIPYAALTANIAVSKADNTPNPLAQLEHPSGLKTRLNDDAFSGAKPPHAVILAGDIPHAGLYSGGLAHPLVEESSCHERVGLGHPPRRCVKHTEIGRESRRDFKVRLLGVSVK